jgi:HSP20 family protein
MFPEEKINKIFNHMDDIFENKFPKIFDKDFTERIPLMNITADKERYKIELAVAGMRKEDFNIDVQANLLTVSCQTEKKSDNTEKMYSRIEYNYSKFSRSVTLPNNADTNKITAQYTDGVLSITIPKTSEPKGEAHKIKIN